MRANGETRKGWGKKRDANKPPLAQELSAERLAFMRYVASYPSETHKRTQLTLYKSAHHAPTIHPQRRLQRLPVTYSGRRLWYCLLAKIHRAESSVMDGERKGKSRR